MRSTFGTKLFDYADLMPYGETSVSLEKWHKDDKDFINANYIKTVYQENHPLQSVDLDDALPYGLMVATSGPKDKTTADFWRMCVQENITKVVSLCEKMGDESGHYKESSQYFPTTNRPVIVIDMPEKNQKLTLSLEGYLDDKEKFIESEKSDEHVTRRQVVATFSYKESNDSPQIEVSHKVEHIHYRSWEDMNVPHRPGAVEALVDIAKKDGADFLSEQYNNLQNGDLYPQKIAIHCMAGVGRTGTLMSLINSFICLKE